MVMAFKGGDKSSGGKRSGVSTGFAGLGAYLLHGDGKTEAERVVFFGSNFGAGSVTQAVDEMEEIAAEHTRLKKPVYHFGFSLPKDETMTREQWEALVYHSVKSLGIDSTEHQILWVLHGDKEHEHIHVVVNRAPLDENARAWRPSHDYPKLERSSRWAEREFGLSRHPSPQFGRTRPGRRTDREFRAVFEGRARTFWSEAVPSFERAIHWTDLAESLAAKGFSVEPSSHHEGGLILRHSSGTAKALGSVDPRFTGPKLADRFGRRFADYTRDVDFRPEPAAPEAAVVSVEHLIESITAHHQVFTLQEAQRAARAFPNGEELLDALWGSPEILRFEHRAAAQKTTAQNTAAQKTTAQKTTARSADGQSEREAATVYFTTRESYKLENAVFERAHALYRERTDPIPLVTSHPLGPEHLAAVRRTLSGPGLSIIQGPPGSGKTSAARAIVESYEAAGWTVQGGAVTGKAAGELRDATGTDVRTLAAWRRLWEHDTATPEQTLLMVDEASMQSLADLRAILDRAENRPIKLVLIGDENQLPPIGAGDPFRRLVHELKPPSLTKIYRQNVDWMREASLDLVASRPLKTLEAYERHERIFWTDSLEQARDRLVRRYVEATLEHSEQSALLIAYRNADVRALNDKIRSTLRQEKRLDPLGYRIGSKDFTVNDRVMFRRNDARSVRTPGGEVRAVQNGSLGTVLAIEGDRFTVRLDRGETVRGEIVVFDARIYSDLDHGYAVSLHKAQGASVDRAYVLADDLFDRNGFMVAATRHREDLEIHVSKDRFESLAAFRDAVSTGPRADLVRDYVEGTELSPVQRPTGLEQTPEPPAFPDHDTFLAELRSTFVTSRNLRIADTLNGYELPELDRRIQSLRHHLSDPEHRAVTTPRDLHTVDQLVESLDVLRHRLAAERLVDAADHSDSASYASALRLYESLPAPRLLPEPPTPTLPSSAFDTLPETIHPTLELRFRRLEVEAYRYRTAAERPVGEPTPGQLEVWAEEATRLEHRLQRASTRLGQAPESSDRLVRILDLQPSAREDLQAQGVRVERAVQRRRGRSLPIDDIERAHAKLIRHDGVAADLRELRLQEDRLPDRAALTDAFGRFDEDTDRLVRRAFDQIYLKPDSAYRVYERHHFDDRNHIDLVRDLLREPQAYGTLKGVHPEKLDTIHARVHALTDQLADRLEQREGLVHTSDRLEALHRRRGELAAELSAIGARADHLATIESNGLRLSLSERAVLPSELERYIDGAVFKADRAVGLYSTETVDFWSQALPSFRASISWQDLRQRLAPLGFELRDDALLHRSSGESVPLSRLHPDLDAGTLTRRFGGPPIPAGPLYESEAAGSAYERPGTHQRSHPPKGRVFTGSAAVPAASRAGKMPALPVEESGTLLKGLSRYRVVWTARDAERHSRRLPDGDRQLSRLWSSGEVLEMTVPDPAHPNDPDKTRTYYTTRTAAALEESVFGHALTLRRASHHAVGVPGDPATPGRSLELDPSGLVVIDGPDDLGRRRTAASLAELYRAAGYDIVATAPTGMAAAALGDATRSQARTLAAWRRIWSEERDANPPPSRKPELYLVDQAGSLDLESMHALLERAAVRNARVVLLGDVHQLPPVGAGDPYRRLTEDVAARRLARIDTPSSAWMREAMEALDRGEPDSALDRYHDEGAVRWSATAADARTAMVSRYFEHLDANAGQTTLLVANTAPDVRALNSEVRAERRRRGGLPRAGHSLAGTDFAPSDRIVFTQNEGFFIRDDEGRRSPVHTGELGTVLHTAPERYSIRLDDGRTVHFDPRSFSRIEHGYALSIRRAGAARVDRVHLLFDPSIRAPAFTTAAGRSREAFELHVPRDRFRDAADLRRAVARRGLPDLVRDFVDGAQELRPAQRPDRSEDRVSEDRADLEILSGDAIDRQLRLGLLHMERLRVAGPMPSELESFEARLELLSRSIDASPESAVRLFTLDRLREAGDVFRHQVAARTLVEAAWNGHDERYQNAQRVYRSLPAPRFLPSRPEPDSSVRTATTQPGHDPGFTSDLEALRREAARYQDIEGMVGPLHAHWTHRGQMLERRLQKAVELVQRHAATLDALQRLDPARPESLPESAVLAEHASTLASRIERLTALPESFRTVHARVDAQVSAAHLHRLETSGPLHEIHRAWMDLQRSDQLTGRIRDIRGKLETLPSRDEARVSLNRHDSTLSATVDRALADIYKDPRAVRRHLQGRPAEQRRRIFHDAPDTLGELKTTFLGRDTAARAAAQTLAKRLDPLIVERQALVAEQQSIEALFARLGPLTAERNRVGERHTLLARIHALGLELPRSERAVLPVEIQEQIAGAERDRAQLGRRAEDLLKQMSRLGTQLLAGKAKAQALRLAPRPLRKLIALGRDLQSLQRSVPAYLVGRLVPAPVRLALYVAKAVTLSQTRSRGGPER